MRLLNESHGNLIDRSTHLLGVMANHFGNRPDIVDRLAELCLMMQSVEVDEVYPIFDELARADAGDGYLDDDLTQGNLFTDL
jgi:hypothetical protein